MPNSGNIIRRSRWTNVGSMLGQRRRRWTTIDPVLSEGPVFAGKEQLVLCCETQDLTKYKLQIEYISVVSHVVCYRVIYVRQILFAISLLSRDLTL